MFTLGVGVLGVVAVAGDAFAQRDAVPDGDHLRSMRTSLTGSFSTRRRSSTVAVSALAGSWVRKPSRSAARAR
jgi:hypothetical protein